MLDKTDDICGLAIHDVYQYLSSKGNKQTKVTVQKCET